MVVLGLDSVPPDLLFERFRSVMPNVARLIDRGRYGVLRSCDPPITVPAWSVIFSGMDPGSLGLYGFRHRRPRTYWSTYTPTPQMIPYPMVWEILSRLGRRVAILGMPPGYPPPKVNGIYVSDFLTPDGAKDFCYPLNLVDEILSVGGGYDFDVTFRADDRAKVGAELFRMTRQHWAVARHLFAKEPWDFFALHDIVPDRIHHTFWKFFDPRHPRYTPNSEFASTVGDYYAMLDQEIGSFLEAVPDESPILVLSDHGSQAMTGCFCVNQWLAEQGYLTIKNPVRVPGTPLEEAQVDWSRTTAWGAGGYYARIFLNVRGREPEGIVPKDRVEELVARLTRDLSGIKGPDGTPLGARVLSPRSIYKEARGDPPDLMVYFGELKWRSAGTLGHPGLFLSENDTGPDDSVHSLDGIFVVSSPGVHESTRLPDQRGIDIAPTILARMGVTVPASMQGRPIDALL